MRPEDLSLHPKHPLDPAQVLADLDHALQSPNAEEIESAVLAAFQVGLRPAFVPSFIGLLGLCGHTCHENLVRALQELKDPRAVDALFRAATVQHEYLNYDEHSGLARKCTWALADIGTPEALSRLRALADSENSIIASNAQKRIERWDVELARKGGIPPTE